MCDIPASLIRFYNSATMSMAASPRKPWENAPSPTATATPSLPTTGGFNNTPSTSAIPFSATYDPTGGSATASHTAADAHALVAANNNRPQQSMLPPTALTPANPLSLDPSAQPILPSPNPMGILPSALYQPGMLPMPGMYPGQPMPVGFNPITHIGSSIQSFGRFSQLLQLNFDALHMSFSSLLRLFDSYSILRAETVMLGQTFTTLNVFAWFGSKMWRLIERLRGRGGVVDMEKGWSEAASANGVGAGGVPLGGKAGQPSFFSGWTWALLVIAVGWSVVRWIIRIVRRRIFGHVDPPPQLPQPAMLPPGAPQPQPSQPNGMPVDPNQPPMPSAGLPGVPGAASPYPMAGVNGLPSSYSSPYSSMGYNGLSSSYGGYGGTNNYGAYGGYGNGYNSYGSSYLGSGMSAGYGTAGYGYGGMSGYGAMGGMGGMSGMSGMSGYGAGGYGLGGLGY